MTNHSEGNSNEAVAETSVHNRKELSADFRFSEIVESTIQGVVDVITQSLTALVVILIHPRSFSKRMEGNRRLSHPMTYLALATLISVQCLSTVIVSPKFGAPSLIGTLTETLSSFSIEGLVTKTFPTIFIVVAIAQLFRLWRFQEDDRVRITKASYFAAGTAFLLLFVDSLFLRLWIFSVLKRRDLGHGIADIEPVIVGWISIGIILAVGSHAALVIFYAMPSKGRRWVDRCGASIFVATAMLFSGYIGDQLRIGLVAVQEAETSWQGDSPLYEEHVYGMRFLWDSASSTGRYSFALRSSANGSAVLFRDGVELRLFKWVGRERIELKIPAASVSVLDWSSSDPRLFTIENGTQWIEIGFTLAEPTDLTSLMNNEDFGEPVSIECRAKFSTGPIRDADGHLDRNKIPIYVDFAAKECEFQ